MRRGLTAGGLSTELPMSHLEGWQQPVNPGTSEPKVSSNPNPCKKQLPSNPQLAGCSEPTPCGGGGGGAEGLALGVEAERCPVLCPPSIPSCCPRNGKSEGCTHMQRGRALLQADLIGRRICAYLQLAPVCVGFFGRSMVFYLD